MSSPLDHENRSTYANIATALSFPYIWVGLFLLFYQLVGFNFFGRGLNGGLVSVVLCFGLLNPAVPGALANYVAKPLFNNLLGREIITAKGCLSGIVVAGLGFVLLLFFLARDLQTALIIFVAAPVVGGVLALLISFLANSSSGGGTALGRRTGGGSSWPGPSRSGPRALPSGPSSRPKPGVKPPSRADRPRLPGK